MNRKNKHYQACKTPAQILELAYPFLINRVFLNDGENMMLAGSCGRYAIQPPQPEDAPVARELNLQYSPSF